MPDSQSPLFDGATPLDRLEGQPRPSAGSSAALIGATTGLELVPVVGGALSALVGGTIDAVTARKRDLWLDEIARRVDVLCEVTVDLDIRAAASDERFVAAARAAYQQVLTEHDQDKIRWLAAAAVNSGSWSALSDARQRYFMGLALSWQPEQMKLFAIMRDDFASWLAERGLDRADQSFLQARQEVTAREIYGDGEWEANRFMEDYTSLMNLRFVDDMPTLIMPPVTDGWHTRLNPLGKQFMAFVSEGGSLADGHG